MNKKNSVVFALIGLLILMCPALAQIGIEEQAIHEAKAWLRLVDSGEYEKSWEQASTLFRNALDQPTWKKALDATRIPLGEVITREVKSAHLATSLPGAPDGEYVVIQFATTFELKESAIETVTPMREEDGSWRVSGYFIR